ncbi:MAG: helix-turn-helix domain-containing protein [Lachnospiraceae bacterium]|nr:helix-turn-helix domain-containing protein [Lachnospiraceae bacterium]
MNLAKNRNKAGVLITLAQACQESNLGSNTVRRLAEESGAVRKIGKCYRINRVVFFDYIEQECTHNNN